MSAPPPRPLSADAATSLIPNLLSPAQLAGWRGLPLAWVDTPGGAWRSTFQAPATSIALLESGRITTRIQTLGRTFDMDVGPGAMALFAAGTQLQVTQAGCANARRILLDLDPARLPDSSLLDDDLLPLPKLLKQDARFQDDALARVIRAMLREILEGCPNGPLYAQSLSLGALLHLGNTRGAKAQAPRERGKLSPAQWARVNELIEERLDDALSLPELAQALSMSKAQFVRLFRNAAGTSPHRYVMRKRVERARHLLLTTDLPLAEVAADAGFANQSHLNRLFMRSFGMTPGDARRSASIRAAY